MTTEFDVFLSHSSIDKPWVIKLKDDLLRYGVSVWLDKDEIRPGDLFAEALESALDNCRNVVLIVSPEAVRSGWVREEYYRAHSLEKARQSFQIIPVLLRKAELPGFLQSRNWVDFQDETDYAQNVCKLVWGVTGEKPTEVLNLSAPAPSTRLTDEYIDALEHDVYLSYADVDNLPWRGSEQGWISEFSQDFETRLKTLLGESPRILRSRKPPDSNNVNEIILEQLCHTAILISVLSPSYVRSKACLEEIAHFQRVAEQCGVFKIDGEFRILMLVKTFVDKQPPETHGLPSYEFFEIEPESDRAREFYPQLGGDHLKKYLAKLDDLTLDVKKVLTMVKTRQRGTPVITKTASATVYLAETTSDLGQERDQIARDLKAHGYDVLPDRPLPVRDPDLENMIRAMLERCVMSIHLVGQSYGIVPEGAASSLAELQNAVAAEHSQNSDFCRLIWFPFDLEVNQVRDERQRGFISDLQTKPAVQRGSDLLQANLEEFKTEILDKIGFILEKASQPKTVSVEREVPTSIYLIYEERDRDDVKPLDDYLYDNGFEVFNPVSDNGRTEEVRKLHVACLKDCDVVLIYHGQTSEVWLRKKLNDLRKISGYGRTIPMLVKAIYIAGPENQQKAEFRTREVDEVIKDFAGFSPQTLAPFLTMIEERKNG